jgi:hypothetical protein
MVPRHFAKIENINARRAHRPSVHPSPRLHAASLLCRILEAEDFVHVSPRDMGVTYDVAERFEQLREQFPKTLATYERALDFTVTHLALLGVKQLEPLTTALYATRQQPRESPEKRAATLMEIKPHVKPAEANEAIMKVDGWIAEVAAS